MRCELLCRCTWLIFRALWTPHAGAWNLTGTFHRLNRNMPSVQLIDPSPLSLSHIDWSAVTFPVLRADSSKDVINDSYKPLSDLDKRVWNSCTWLLPPSYLCIKRRH